MSAKQYRPWELDQLYLLPPSPREWLPEKHLAYFILEIVEELDLSEIESAIHVKDARGERPYSPRMMVALLLYAYCVGVFSSRKIARETYEDVAFRALCGEAHPHFTTINQFRLDHRAAFMALFLQVLRLCKKAKLVKLGHVALDGTKVLASASKHKAMSYDRMKKEEQRLATEIAALVARAEAVDREEDERFGVGQEPEDLPAELQRREARLATIRQAKAELEREAAATRAEELRALAAGQRDKAADPAVPDAERARAVTRADKSEQQASALSAKDDDDDSQGSGGTASADLPKHRVPTEPDGTPKPKAQRNFTDPDSRIMRHNGAVVQAYNAQAAVDAESQIIVAEAVTNQAPDCQHFVPILDRVRHNCGRDADVTMADSGFFSKDNADACAGRTDAYIAVGRERDASPAGEPTTGPDTAAALARSRMRDKLRTEHGKKIYARRKAIVEPPFGQIKEARGFRRFSQRGLDKVRCEWTLVCLTHNLLKLFRAPGAWALALA